MFSGLFIKAIIQCSSHSAWFVKYVFSAKIWFMKPLTRIMIYESWIVKLKLEDVLHFCSCCKCLILYFCITDLIEKKKYQSSIFNKKDIFLSLFLTYCLKLSAQSKMSYSSHCPYFKTYFVLNKQKRKKLTLNF